MNNFYKNFQFNAHPIYCPNELPSSVIGPGMDCSSGVTRPPNVTPASLIRPVASKKELSSILYQKYLDPVAATGSYDAHNKMQTNLQNIYQNFNCMLPNVYQNPVFAGGTINGLPEPTMQHYAQSQSTTMIPTGGPYSLMQSNYSHSFNSIFGNCEYVQKSAQRTNYAPADNVGGYTMFDRIPNSDVMNNYMNQQVDRNYLHYKGNTFQTDKFQDDPLGSQHFSMSLNNHGNTSAGKNVPLTISNLPVISTNSCNNQPSVAKNNKKLLSKRSKKRDCLNNNYGNVCSPKRLKTNDTQQKQSKTPDGNVMNVSTPTESSVSPNSMTSNRSMNTPTPSNNCAQITVATVQICSTAKFNSLFVPPSPIQGIITNEFNLDGNSIKSQKLPLKKRLIRLDEDLNNFHTNEVEQSEHNKISQASGVVKDPIIITSVIQKPVVQEMEKKDKTDAVNKEFTFSSHILSTSPKCFLPMERFSESSDSDDIDDILIIDCDHQDSQQRHNTHKQTVDEFI